MDKSVDNPEHKSGKSRCINHGILRTESAFVYIFFMSDRYTLVMAPRLHHDFSKSSCPAGLPMWEDGINAQPQTTKFADVIKTAARNADIVMLGDTNHFDPAIHGLMARDENLHALKEAGYTHITIEVSNRMQHWIDKFNRDELTQKEFEDKIHMSLQVAQSNEDGEWTRQIGKVAAFAKDNNMRLVFIDPGNGEKWCSNDLKGEELEACELENDRDRFRDAPLSASLNSLLKETPDAKVFQIYGSAHYSVDNGSKELLEGKSLKIDVYRSRSSYEADKADLKQDHTHAQNMGWGAIKPDLVYMMETQDAYTTCATPPAFAAGLSKDGEAPKASDNRPPALQGPSATSR